MELCLCVWCVGGRGVEKGAEGSKASEFCFEP